MIKQYIIKTNNSVKDLKKDEWNDLSASVYTSYEWIKSVEESQTLKTDSFFIRIYEGDELIAFAMMYNQIKYWGPTLSEVFLGKYYKFFPYKLNPCLLCYSPFNSIGRGFEIRQDKKNETNIILKMITEEMKKICQQKKIGNYGFLNICGQERESTEALEQNGFIKAFTCYNTYIPVVWNDFEEYLMFLNKKRRGEIRREIKIYSEKKFKDYVDCDLKSSEARKIINDSKHSGGSRVYVFPLEFLRSLKKNFGSKLLFFYNKRNEDVVSLAISLEHKNNIYAYKIGQNEDLAKGSFSLFVVGIYNALEYAIKYKLSNVVLGPGNYNYKLNRGALPEPLFLFIKSDNSFRHNLNKFFLFVLGGYKKRKHKKQAGL